MSFGGIVLLAVGVAMDATAIAGTKGLAAPRIRMRDALVTAGYFGGFQALMPLLGWCFGSWIGPAVAAWDHWIAFILLTAIGGKMLWDARAAGPKQPPDVDPDLFGFRQMITLALATSIDAFAIGVTLPILDAPLVLSVATMGVTTAVLSGAGVYAGRRLGAALGRRLDTIGGVVLIGMGIRILLQHLSAGHQLTSST